MAKSASLLAAFAARRAGAFSADEASRAGYTPDARREAVESGRWQVLHRGVFAIAGTADSPERRLWGAKLALGPESKVVRRSALWVWDMLDAPELPELCVPPSHSGRRPGIVVHRQDFSRADHTRRRGFDVTTPTRSLLDAGAVLSQRELEDAYDRGVALKRVTPASTLAHLERSARSGRPGSAGLRKVLLAQGVGSDRSPSYLEAKALRLFRRAGLPEPHVESTWGSRGQFRLDFIWIQFGLVVEVDGWDCHSSHKARQHDLSRRNRIVLGDLRPLIYTYTDTTRRGATVVAEVREAMANAGRRTFDAR